MTVEALVTARPRTPDGNVGGRNYLRIMIQEQLLVAPSPLGVQLIQVNTRLWRVVERSGRVCGHIEALPARSEVRYRARRFRPAIRAFMEVGDFWSVSDAVAALRA